MQEVVEVSAHASLVDANTSAVGKLVDNRRIAELPLNTRNVYSLIFLTPGVSGTIGNAYGDLRYTINGARPRTSDTLVDGVTATFPTVTGGVGISVFPSVDAIQEFKVLGATYPAEFGRSLGSVINVVYKSGSNDVPWQRVRVPARLGVRFARLLSAAAQRGAGRLFAAPVRRRRGRADPARQDVLPGLLRGTPGKRDSRPGRRRCRPRSNGRVTFRRPSRRTASWSAFSTRSTTRANPAGGFIRDQFADNKIPSALWDPVALNVLKYYPLPNQPGEPVTGRNNYVASGTADSEHQQHRPPPRPQFRRERARLRALLVPPGGEHPAAGVPRRPRDCRGPRDRGEPRSQLRRRVQPDDRPIDAVDGAARLRAHAVRLQQPGARLPAVEPGSAGVDRRGCRPDDVPRVRRDQLRVARRQRSPLQRVHELSAAGEPHEDGFAAHAQDRRSMSG